MTIQIKYGDNINNHSIIYRKVYKHRMAQYTEGFAALQKSHQWGVMLQLKGTERITLRKFGVQPS